MINAKWSSDQFPCGLKTRSPAPASFRLRLPRVQAIDGVPKIEGDYNPATWVLEVSNTSVENRTGLDFADLYEGSQLYKCAFTHSDASPSAKLLRACSGACNA